MKNIMLFVLVLCLSGFELSAQQGVLGTAPVFINIPGLQQQLKQAPKLQGDILPEEGLSISLPLPNGKNGRYWVFANALLSADFKSQFPGISTYTITAGDNLRQSGSLTICGLGMHAMIPTSDGIIEIRRSDNSGSGQHEVGYQSDNYLECEVEELQERASAPANSKNFNFSSGDQLRSYNLAIVTTGEFYRANSIGINDVPQADLAVSLQVAAIVNGINTIYRNEVGSVFTLLAPFLYRNPATDVFDPASSDSRTTQAQAGVSANFTDDQYDIGHVFNDSNFCGSPIRQNIDGTENAYRGAAIDNNGFCAAISGPNNLNFQEFIFRVSTTGSYTFSRTANTTMDEGIALYNAFDNTSPNACTGFLGASRTLDNTGTLTATRNAITATLTAGVNYQLVVFSATVGSTGLFEISIAGPGFLTSSCQFGGGGVATVGVVCDDGSKGRGWSSISNTGDVASFARLAAHEFGHQFSARHTFNGNGGSCTAANINSNFSYEIGSGTTIMSYSGICGAGQNVPASGAADNYFFNKSLAQIINYINANNCEDTQNSLNSPPVANANPSGESYTIPGGTPFELLGEGSDADGDALTYCWEQCDEDGPGMTPTQGLNGAAAGANPLAPLFRSYPPTSTALRTFPILSDILFNSNIATFEALPTVDRTLNFSLTVRDNNIVAGGVSCDNTAVTVDGDTGPFRVTDPNLNGCLVSGGMEFISWDVAGSDGGDVNCAEVDILLSIDGGLTFPFVLASNEPNDGIAEVMLPAMVRTLTGRIRIGCSDNIFFDINDEDIVIECPDLLIVSDNPASGIYRAGNRLETSGTVQVFEDTDFLAGTTVMLRDGFLARPDPGHRFLARIQDCDPCLLTSPFSAIIPEGEIEETETDGYVRTPFQFEVSNPDQIREPIAYPNPFTDGFTLDFELGQSSPVEIRLFAATGGKPNVLFHSDFLAAGRHQIQLETNTLPAGVFYCQIVSSNGKQLTKLIKISH